MFGVMGRISPPLGARCAEMIFCRPPAQRTRPDEEAFIATGRPLGVTYEGGAFSAWEWGTGPTIVLAHGWGSRAGRWAPAVPALVAAGFRVVAYDAPAHGGSPGFRASLPEFAAALRAVAAATGPLHAAVGHSLGGTAVAVALSQGLTADRAVLIAAPADPASYADRLAEELRLTTVIRRRMQQNLERRLRLSWDAIHLPSIVRELTTPALIIHDRDDPDVSADNAEAIVRAWPGAALLLTGGLGHGAILRDRTVIAAVTEFVTR